MKLLRQTTSGEIYVWDEQLAKRPDMEIYVRPEVQSEPVRKEQPETEQVAVVEEPKTAPVKPAKKKVK